MRLFFPNFAKLKMPNGHIFRGKNRLVKQVTLGDIAKLRTQFEIEEKNMFYLRHAYLTPKQSFGHAQALGIPENRRLKILCTKKDFKNNVTIESRLGHLRYKDAWE